MVNCEDELQQRRHICHIQLMGGKMNVSITNGNELYYTLKTRTFDLFFSTCRLNLLNRLPILTTIL